MHFLGYYQKFCGNFLSVVGPLTKLLRKDQAYVWDDNSDKAFTKIKALLLTVTVSVTPDYYKLFKLQVDTSDQGVGIVYILLQDRKCITQLVISPRNSINITGVFNL